MTNLDVYAVAAKAIGAFVGAFGSVAFFIPDSTRDAILRFTASVPSGIVFGPVARSWLETWVNLESLTNFERTMSGSFLAALCCWFVVGVAYHVLHKKTK